MANRTLADEIITIIEANANNNPAPVLATVTKVYTDNCIDARLSNNVYKYIRTIGEPVLDTNVVIVFTDEEVPVAVCGNVDLSNYYTKQEVDDEIESIIVGDLSDYVKESELNTILSSYATISFANSTYAPIVHTHSQYIRRDEISDLDIDLSTLELVPYNDNPNGVMCFQRVNRSIEELDIELSADTMSNGYFKIEANLIEREVDNNGSNS